MEALCFFQHCMDAGDLYISESHYEHLARYMFWATHCLLHAVVQSCETSHYVPCALPSLVSHNGD